MFQIDFSLGAPVGWIRFEGTSVFGFLARIVCGVDCSFSALRNEYQRCSSIGIQGRK
jgi:hypothetical protein